MTVGELLDYVVAESLGASCRVCGNAVLIGPAYQPPGSPLLALTTLQLVEQKLGPPVSLAVEQVPLSEALEQLRWLTGANIVASVGADVLQKPLTATFDNVRLFTALTLVADMAEAKLVVLENVYYVTLPGKGDRLKQEYDSELYGPKPTAAAK